MFYRDEMFSVGTIVRDVRDPDGKKGVVIRIDHNDSVRPYLVEWPDYMRWCSHFLIIDIDEIPL